MPRKPATPEYKAWGAMKQRCLNPKVTSFKCYGGNGITVCEKWQQSFAAFLADVGYKPSPAHSLDRYPDTSGNYEPSNVRWATPDQQASNRRNRRGVSVLGRRGPCVPGDMLRQAVAYNLPIESIGSLLGIAPDRIAHIMSLGAVARRDGRLTA